MRARFIEKEKNESAKKHKKEKSQTNLLRGNFTMWKKLFSSLLAVVLGVFLFATTSYAAPISLYTPYTGISLTPGESISYTVDIINDSNEVQNVSFKLENLPEDWDYSIRSGGNSIQQLSVRPQDEEDITLEVEVPLEVDKGRNEFRLVAEGNDGETTSLPFMIEITEKGTFQTEFTSDQPNMEGHADSEFSYSTTLKNQTAEEQHYGLSAQAPEGWFVQFKVGSDSVTSVTLEPNESQDIKVEVVPAENATAETYTIPVVASAGSVSEEIELEAVITGKYDIELTTETGNLSSDVTAGGSRTIDLIVENKGSVELVDIELESNTPPNWDVSFNVDSIKALDAGERATIKATLTAPDDAIAGDYVTTFTASTPEVSSDATFRMSVKTSTLWGFVAIGIIIVVLGGLFVIFRKYGRR